VHTAYTAACRRANCLPRAQEFYQDLLRQHPEAKGIYGRLRRVAAAMAATPAGEETDDTR